MSELSAIFHVPKSVVYKWVKPPVPFPVAPLPIRERIPQTNVLDVDANRDAGDNPVDLFVSILFLFFYLLLSKNLFFF
jgi:hypothetical protein